MAKKSFDKAFSELQAIIEEIQTQEISIDKLSAQTKKAAQLVKYCREKLRSIENELSEEEE